MADVENTYDGPLGSARSVELRVAARLENLAVLRTLVAAVGSAKPFVFTPVWAKADLLVDAVRKLNGVLVRVAPGRRR